MQILQTIHVCLVDMGNRIAGRQARGDGRVVSHPLVDGFTADRARGLQSPYDGAYFLACDLQVRAGTTAPLEGTVQYAAPFVDLA